MLNALLGTKSIQTQTFDEKGNRLPVTDIVTGPIVVQVKTADKDGYWAVQLGLGIRRTKNTSKPLLGHLKKTGKGNQLPRFLREIKFDGKDEDVKKLKIGDMIVADQVFQIGDKVKVTGISKAKGFAGGVKRHGFAGGPRTHGQSDRERAPGSIGQTTTPGRVYKGKRMAGRMGGVTKTVKGLKIFAIDNQKNLIRVKGLIPGNMNSPVLVEKE
jgi:large subunit ribosomal protein L3